MVCVEFLLLAPRDSHSALLRPAVCPRRLPCTKGLRWLLVSVGFGGGWGILATGKREREECEVGFLSALSPWAGCIPLLKATALSGSPLHALVLVNCSSPNPFRFTGDNNSALIGSRISWVLYTLVTLCKSSFY